jgi:hypothetical protein
MRAELVCILLPLVLLGCSKNQPQMAATQISAGSLPAITVVEPPEALEQKQIEQQSLAFLNDKNYDQLEALASQYRASKEAYADGLWKLFSVYTGLELSNGDTDAAWQERENQIQVVYLFGVGTPLRGVRGRFGETSLPNSRVPNGYTTQIHNWIQAKPASVTARVELGRFWVIPFMKRF